MAEVGLNGLLLDYPHSGTAVYTRNLAPLLPEVAPDLDFRLFVRHPKPTPDGVAIDRLATPFAASNRGAGVGARLDKLAWETVLLPLASAKRRQVLLHSLYLAAPAVSPCPVVVTIHDLIGQALPDYHRSRQAQLYHQLMSGLARRASAIVTVSEFSRSDIVQRLGLAEERVHVTYEAVDERFSPQPTDEDRDLRDRYGLPQQFILYVGSAERRKNLSTLVRAWASVSRRMKSREVKLVIVAHFPPPDKLYPDVPAEARSMGLVDDILFLDHVDERDKPALYRASIASCFPSLYEGFGFPPLESMACGTPVLASSATSIPEVVGKAGVLISPDDVGAWASALLEIVDASQLRADLVRSGLERARRFSWRKTAEETVDVYRTVLGQ